MTNKQSLISGYGGFMKQPVPQPIRYGPTVYYLSDSFKRNILAILLTPDTFFDTIMLMKIPSIQNTWLSTPSLNIMYISDIFLTYNELKKVKPYTKWIYPGNIPMNSNSEFINDQLKEKRIALSYIWQQNAYSASIEFIPIDSSETKFDIILRDGSKTIYFAYYMDEEKMDLLFNDKRITEIHIPYSFTYFGGMNFIELEGLDKYFKTKLVANTFVSIEEFELYKSIGYRMPNNVTSQLLSTGGKQ